MTDSTAREDALAAWTRKLAAPALPVFPETIIRLRRLLHGGNESIRALARIAVSDPAFAFHVFREANALVQETRNVFYDLEHAMSMLGLQRVRALIENVPTIPEGAATWTDGYRQQLAISHHAGLQTLTWLEYRKRASPYEAQWMAALRTAPLWAISRADPKTMQRLAACFRGPRRSLVTRLSAVLGCDFNALTAALFQHWKLERFIRPLLAHEQLCPPPTISAFARLGDTAREQRAMSAFPHRALLNDNLTFAVIANLLALNSADNWYSRGTLRAERAAAGLLNLQLPNAIHMVHYGAVKITRSLAGPAGGQPAVGLLEPLPVRHRPLPPRAQTRPRPAGKTPTPKPTPATAAASASATRLRQAVAALRDSQGTASGLPGILRALVEGLHGGLGLERVLIFSRNREGILQLRLQAGLAGHPALTTGTTVPTQTGDLFSQLLGKPSALHVTAANRAAVLGRLPPQLKEVLRPLSFCICSLAFREQPMVLVYADLGSRGGEISADRYRRYRQVCNEAARALEKLAG